MSLICIYGFFPTEISTNGSVPDITFSVLLTPFSCGGERLEERLELSANAALRCGGSSSAGSAWRDGADSVDSTDMVMPVFTPCDTARVVSWLNILSAGWNGVPGWQLLPGWHVFHSARCNIPSICLSRLIDSSSPNTEKN